jgi:hypothetical protein
MKLLYGNGTDPEGENCATCSVRTGFYTMLVGSIILPRGQKKRRKRGKRKEKEEKENYTAPSQGPT